MSTLITILGWEDRFYRGTEITIEENEISHLVLITFTDYLSMKDMVDNKSKLESLAKSKGIQIDHIELNYTDSVNNWKIIDREFHEISFSDNIMLNIIFEILNPTLFNQYI